MKYLIAESRTAYGLTKLVQEQIENGYEPIGGVSVACNDAGSIHSYVQAMIERSAQGKGADHG